MDVDRCIGERVREVRTRLGWTQTELAEELARFGFDGASAATISRMEQGKRERRRVSVVEWLTLALALRVPPLDLLTPLPHGDRPLDVGTQTVPTTWQAYQWAAGLSTDVRVSGHALQEGTSAKPYATYLRFLVFAESFTEARHAREVLRDWDEDAPPKAARPDPDTLAERVQDLTRSLVAYGRRLEQSMRALVALDMPLPGFPRAYLWDLAQTVGRDADFPLWLDELGLTITEDDR